MLRERLLEDALAMIRRVAIQWLEVLCPLPIQMQIVFPGVANATMNLDRFAADSL